VKPAIRAELIVGSSLRVPSSYSAAVGPNESIRRILEAGVCAPSGGNMQRWRFLVVRDPNVKERVGALYKRAWDEQWGRGIGLANRLLG